MDKTVKQLQEELDAVITWFQSDDVDIDQAEDKYNQGLEIAVELKKRLEKTENAITKLKAKFDEDNS